MFESERPDILCITKNAAKLVSLHLINS